MRSIVLLGLVCTLTGCASVENSSTTNAAASSPLAGEMIHACECTVYCPCPFKKDAVHDTCRSLTVWMIDSGAHGGVDLANTWFAVSMTKAGKNVAAAKGSWEGVLLIPERFPPARRSAISDLVRDRHGGGFAVLDSMTPPSTLERRENHFEMRFGDIATLRVEPLRGAGGGLTVVENPPSPPMGLATLVCGVTPVHTYDDGETRWDFSGRNAYYGPFTMDGRSGAHAAGPGEQRPRANGPALVSLTASASDSPRSESCCLAPSPAAN